MSALEHRRAQNRMAQRRFRQRQNQQKAAAEQRSQINSKTQPHPLQSRNLSELYAQHNEGISTSDLDSFQTLNSSSDVNGCGATSTSSPSVNSQSAPYNFGFGCRLALNNGIPGVQSFTDMDNLDLYAAGLESTSASRLLSAPSTSTSESAMRIDRISEIDRRECSSPSPRITSENVSSRNSNNDRTSLSDSLELAGISMPTSTSNDAATSNSHNTGIPANVRTATSGEPGSGWLSPLHMAAQNGHDQVVRVLLQHDIDCNEADSDGLTPLIHATIGGHEDVVMLLLSHGADISRTDGKSRSVLHWAAIHKREALLKILLEHCIGDRRLIDGYDEDGRTPLHVAVDSGFEAGVQALLHSGASLHYRAKKKLG